MGMNLFKPRGAPKNSQPDAGGAVLRTTPMFGIVKDNIDPIRSGRLRVYISDIGGLDPETEDSWIHVNYMSPFYGVTGARGPESGYGNFEQNPSSYGMWTSPPDVGTTVICIFINGDPNYGFWIGCVPQPEALYMVPAIAGAEDVILNSSEAKSYGGATRLPVMNMNTNDEGKVNSNKFLDTPKPVHSYVAQSLMQQGLIRDPIRGVISSSAQRETPSRVGFGVSTPGRPIYSGGLNDQQAPEEAKGNNGGKLRVEGRRGGHSIVMDDGDIAGRDNLVRIRTSLGHQIIMSDDGQCLFLIHANGSSWIELGKEGTIDMYATNSVNIRTQGDLNLHADNNFNIHAKKNFTLSAENIKISSDYKTELHVGSDFSQLTKGKHALKVNGQMSQHADGEASYLSKNITYINGSKINLNTGQASFVPQNVEQPELVAHTDTIFDSVKGWAAAPGKLLSVTSRAPAHAPWAMANQGVDVKVSNNSSDAFPASPTEPQVAAYAATPSAPNNPVSPATIAALPTPQAISQALDQNTTAAMIGQVATLAATSPAANVINTVRGMGEIVTNNGVQGVIGKFAFSPNNMEQAGVLKTGSGDLVNALIQSGKTVEQALTPNLFTGVPGAENLQAFAQNTNAQIQAQITNFQKAQTALTRAGAMSGKETPAAIAGMVTVGAVNGIDQAVNYVKGLDANGSLITNAAGAITNTINNTLGLPNQVAAAGKFAANMGATVTSGLSSIASSLTGLKTGVGGAVQNMYEAARGVAGSAFNAIVKSFPAMQANVPQNLTQIVKSAQEQVQGVTGSANIVTESVAAVSTGLAGLPGAEKTVASIVNKNLPSSASIPASMSNVTAAINQAASSLSATTGNATSQLISSLQQGGKTLQGLVSTGLPASAAAELNSAISSLSSAGSVPIKLPKVAIDTVDRSQIDSLISSTLGSTKIPLPLYKGNPATLSGPTASENAVTFSEEKLAEQGTLLNEIAALDDRRFDLEKDYRNAIGAYEEARNTLPAGDPKIQAAKDLIATRKAALADLDRQIVELRNRVAALAGVTVRT